MELAYSSKKTPAEIISTINKIKNSCRLDKNITRGILFNSDNFKAMSLLLNSYANKVDLIYIDPPFNTNLDFYYSVDRTAHVSNVKSAQVAYSDCMHFESYIEFIRERLILIHMLLSDSGTLYFHIDINVGHYIKILLDSIFGRENFLNEITRIKSNPKNFKRNAYGNEKDTIYVYSKSSKKNIFNDIKEQFTKEEIAEKFPKADEFGRKYTTVPCHAPGETVNGATGQKWNNISPPPGRHWRYSPEELDKMDAQGLIEWSKNNVPRIKKFADDCVGKKIQDVWTKYKDPQYPVYPTEKNAKMLELIVRQSSHKNSLIMDCFCGSGSFLAAGMRLGRRVIGIDKSEVAIKVARQRSELQQLPLVTI